MFRLDELKKQLTSAESQLTNINRSPFCSRKLYGVHQSSLLLILWAIVLHQVCSATRIIPNSKMNPRTQLLERSQPRNNRNLYTAFLGYRWFDPKFQFLVQQPSSVNTVQRYSQQSSKSPKIPKDFIFQDWRKLDALPQEKERDIFQFVRFLTERNILNYEPAQMYNTIHIWERFKQRKIRKEREHLIREYQQRQMTEKNARFMRKPFHQDDLKKLNKLGQAKTFKEFQQILLNQKDLTSNVNTTPELTVSTFAVAPLTQPGHLLTNEGGVVMESLRSNREVRSVLDQTESLKDDSSMDGEKLTWNRGYRPEPLYSESELRNAFEGYQIFKRTTCQPERQTICMHSLLQMSQSSTTLIIPPAIVINRCDGQKGNVAMETSMSSIYSTSKYNFGSTYKDHYIPPTTCSCERPDEVCLPTSLSLKTQAVAKTQIQQDQTYKYSTELIILTEHNSCGCLPRCLNRLCIPPLKLIIHTSSDCFCLCPETNQRCHDLLEGKQQFAINEIPLPLNASYILPPCRYGIMDDVNLYHRRCPQTYPFTAHQT